MEFGRVTPAELKRVDFTLPPDPKQTTAVLAKGRKKAKQKVYVGCAKWGRKEWVGKIYPKGTKEADFLEHYAKRFNCIELNAMFYSIHSDETIARWVSKAGKDFMFCPKFNNSITHIRRLKNADDVTTKFLHALTQFGDTLGPAFLQLSDNYSPAGFEVMEQYLKALPTDLEVFVEVRHKDWWLPENAEKLFTMLEKLKKGSVITDASGRRDCVHMRLSTPKAFIRFVGNGKHATDYTRIDDWVERINSWLKEGIEEVYFFMHQHEELHSPEMARYTIEQLNKKCKLDIPLPEFVGKK